MRLRVPGSLGRRHRELSLLEGRTQRPLVSSAGSLTSPPTVGAPATEAGDAHFPRGQKKRRTDGGASPEPAGGPELPQKAQIGEEVTQGSPGLYGAAAWVTVGVPKGVTSSLSPRREPGMSPGAPGISPPKGPRETPSRAGERPLGFFTPTRLLTSSPGGMLLWERSSRGQSSQNHLERGSAQLEALSACAVRLADRREDGAVAVLLDLRG